MPHKDCLADEVVAFANANVTVTLLSVDDKVEIVGIDRQNLNNVERPDVEICHNESAIPIIAKRSQTNPNIVKFFNLRFPPNPRQSAIQTIMVNGDG